MAPWFEKPLGAVAHSIYIYTHVMIRARNVRGAVQCSHAGRCGQLKMPSRLSVTENQMEKTMDNEMEAGIA